MVIGQFDGLYMISHFLLMLSYSCLLTGLDCMDLWMYYGCSCCLISWTYHSAVSCVYNATDNNGNNFCLSMTV